MADTTTPQSRGQITNPYDAEHRAKYNMGSVEAFLHDKLGFRTGIDTYNENMDNASAAWLAQQENNAYEENYNSAEAQAERMRAAGLNPDIAPNTVAPGEATEFTEPENAPQAPEGQDMEILGKAGETGAKVGMMLLNILTGSAGAVSDIGNMVMGVKQFTQNYERGEVAYDNELLDLVERAHKTYGDLYKDEKGLSYVNSGYIAKRMGMTGKKYAKFVRAYDDLYNSIPSINARLQNENDTEKANYDNWFIKKTKEVQDLTMEATAQAALIEAECKRREAEYLKDHPEYTREMLQAGLQKEKAEAAMAGNQARISEIEKDLKEWNKIEAENEHNRTVEDQKIIQDFEHNTSKFDYNAFSGNIPEEELYHTAFYHFGGKYIKKWLQYRRANKRRYKQSGTNEDVIADAGGKIIGIIK